MLRLRRLLALIVVAPVAFAVAPAQAVTRDGGGGARAIPVASAASRTVVTLGGVRVRLPAGSEQVVTVNRTAGWHARVKLWQRDTSGWRVLARTHDGRIGYGGLAVARTRKQATGTTPLGTFGLLSAFGTHARAARWTLPYRTIQRGDFWVEDNGSAYYNRYRNQAEGGFRWWLPLSDPDSSERLSHYPTQYEYAIVIGFFVHRELTFDKLRAAFTHSISDIGLIMIIILMSGMVGFAIIYLQVPQHISTWMLTGLTSPSLIVLVILLFLLIAGCFIESTVLVLLLTPIFVPVVSHVGIDPVHFGILMMSIVTLGGMTPPVGVAMFAVCSLMDVKIEEYTIEALPFLATVIVLIVFLLFFPGIVLWLPNLAFG